MNLHFRICQVLAAAVNVRAQIPWCCWGLAEVRGGEEGLCRALVVVLTHRHCRLFQVSPGEQLLLAAEHLHQRKTQFHCRLFLCCFIDSNLCEFNI